MKLYFATAFCVACISLFGQTAKEEYAKSLMDKFDYKEAYPVWVELAQKDEKKGTANPIFLRMAVKSASAYENYADALRCSKKLVRMSKAEASDWQIYFDLLCLNKKYSELDSAISVANKKFSNNETISNWNLKKDEILKSLKDTTAYSVKPFRKEVAGEEFAAVPYGEGYVLVSNSLNTGFVNRLYNRTGQHFTDLIYISEKKDSSSTKLWREIKRTNPHDGPIYFSKDLKTAILTVNHEETDLISRVKYSRLALKTFRLTENEWVQDSSFLYNKKTYSVGHAALNKNGDLIFASDMPGGFGGVDLYICKLNDGKWGVPENMGPMVNTFRDEMFPYYSEDETLYFASNGWTGLGGLDVFSTIDQTKKPVNLGVPINSNADDFAFNINDSTGYGYLSSNRLDWKDQVYVIYKKPFRYNATLSIVDCDNKPMANTDIAFIYPNENRSENQVLDEKGQVSFKMRKDQVAKIVFPKNEKYFGDSLILTAGADGEYNFVMSPEIQVKSTKITILDAEKKPIEGVLVKAINHGKIIKSTLTDKDGFIFWNEPISFDTLSAMLMNYYDVVLEINRIKTKCTDSIVSIINMMELQQSEKINLDLVLYDFDQFSLRPEGKKELDKLTKYMLERPDIKVELSSHTDSRGIDVYNDWLSEKRSNSCVDYIISQGVSKDRIVAKGYGEAKLKNKCSNGVECTEEEHQQNRRTEIRLIIN
jgi:outer membrane protein OmpA-like peptidoglycan-associated protein